MSHLPWSAGRWGREEGKPDLAVAPSTPESSSPLLFPWVERYLEDGSLCLCRFIAGGG